MRLLFVAVMLLNAMSSLALNFCQSEENAKNEASTIVSERTKSVKNALTTYQRGQASYESTVKLQNEIAKVVDVQNNYVGHLGAGLNQLEELIKIVGNDQSNTLQLLSDLNLAFSTQQSLLEVLAQEIEANEAKKDSKSNQQLLAIYNELSRSAEAFQQIKSSYVYINNVVKLGKSSLEPNFVAEIFSEILQEQISLEMASAKVMEAIQTVNIQYEQFKVSQKKNLEALKAHYDSEESSLKKAKSTYKSAKNDHDKCKDKVDKAVKALTIGIVF